MSKTLVSLILLIISLTLPTRVSADVSVAGSSAQLKQGPMARNDPRVEKLRRFLARHKSPLSGYAYEFVNAADKYGLDWRLVPAISGVESTFGKRIPRGSYNAYGWANGDFRFDSWENSINIVSQSLKIKYIDKGAPSINKIARRYAPPSSTWAWKVKYFMEKIEPFPVNFDLEG